MKLRFRHVYVFFGSLMVVLLSLLSDPDTGVISSLPFGAGTLVTFLILLKSVLYVALLHFSRKALIDYLDLETVFEKATQTPDGAGKAAIAVALFSVSIAIVIYAATR